MKRQSSLLAAAVLILCLSFAAPAAAAVRDPGYEPDYRTRIVRIIKHMVRALGFTSLTDYPAPPKP